VTVAAMIGVGGCMLAVRVPASAEGPTLGALIVRHLGMWEPGLGFWRREPLVAIGGLAAVGAEFRGGTCGLGRASRRLGR
jgi:hypothetical protein